MRHSHFTIQIGPRQARGYIVYVSSPAGEYRCHLNLSPIQDQLSELLHKVDQSTYRRRALIAPSDGSEEPIRAATLRRFGDTLFRALFRGRTLSLLDRSLGMTEKQGLRIILQFDSKDPLVSSLPWEFLYRGETRDFLGLSRWSPVVRRLEAYQSPRDLPLPSTLRILVIAASPPEAPPLDTEVEVRNIRQAWQGHGNVEVHVLESARIESLRETMSEHPFHILHFAGHGDFRHGQGVLLFGGKDHGADPVAGEFLADHLKDFRSLRLVFFNACDTAKIVDQEEYDPFASVAAAMVLGGVPAVVAMQFPISDRAAVAFSQAFYRRLAAGDPVDIAMAEGRLAIRAQDPDTMEWGTPVVFLRDTDSRLWRSTPEVIGWPWNRGRGSQAGLPPKL